MFIRSAILHHDNAGPHTAVLTLEKLDKISWRTLDHPPYSPYLLPCDYHTFGPLNGEPGGHHFDDLPVQKRLTTTVQKRSCAIGYGRDHIHSLVTELY